MRVLPFICLLAVGLSAYPAEQLPAADEVLERVLERAQAVARTTNHYIYEKRSVTAELDDEGRPLKSKEKLYQVRLVGGLPFPRLVKVQGRELTAKELERENQREMEFRRRVTRVDVNRKAKRKEALATRELVDRFDFKVTKRELIEQRPTLVLAFTPRKGAQEESIEDKVFQRVSGTVWVDEQEAEIRKLDASVRGPVPLGWFGAVGSLNKFRATLERARMPDGEWMNRKSSFSIVARRVFTAVRYETTEESSGFRKE